MAKKTGGLIYDNDSDLRAELLLEAAMEHEEQLRKAALFWAGVTLQLNDADSRTFSRTLDDLAERLGAVADAFELLSDALGERLPDEEDDE